MNEIQTVADESTRLHAQAAAMRVVLNSILGLINESYGVTGYHLNGEVATWGELNIENEILDVLRTDAGELTLRWIQKLETLAGAVREFVASVDEGQELVDAGAEDDDPRFEEAYVKSKACLDQMCAALSALNG